jgi:multimeric flavodoxin WrbA
MSDRETTDYKNAIRDVEIKYKSIIQRREFQSVSYMMWLIIFGVQRLVSVVLRFPFFRAPYVSAMNSRSSPKKLRDLLGWGVRRAVTVHPPLSRAFTSGKALIIYYSTTGNTEKVALAVQQGVRKAGLEPIIKKVSESFGEELYGYDLVCIGTPVIHGLPPHPVMKFMLEKGSEYRRRNDIRIDQQPIPGKNALVFVTFSGPHIGVVEAIPAGKYLQQSLAHMGFDVKGEWYVVGEFHGWKDGSTKGRLGDIRGRPNAQDLVRIEEKTIELVKSLNDVSAFPFSATVWCSVEES